MNEEGEELDAGCVARRKRKRKKMWRRALVLPYAEVVQEAYL